MWEYVTLQFVVGGFEDEATAIQYNTIMNEYGADGWELVSTQRYISPLAGGEVVILFFKKPLAQLQVELAEPAEE